uniref:Inositol-pentakisphosphate 2-kinase n=1 Tax=Aceria tosichella TaxID=561515 RepID=A0A6G1SJP7_9ACAR
MMRFNEFNDDLMDQIIYRGEGNSSIVVAIKNRSKVIRLLKKDGKIMRTSQDHHVTQHPMRSIKFIHLIMKPLTSPYLSDATQLVHLKSDFINMLSKKVEVERPSHRLDKTLHLDDQYALVMDDLCTLPDHLIRHFNEVDFSGPTISVEIKPKQGFLLPTHRSLMRSSINDQMTAIMKGSCLYGLNQNMKLARGRIKETSNYCPINLFSGCPIKMESALEALLRNPQNNLRIFKNLGLAYDESNHLISDLFKCNSLNNDPCCATAERSYNHDKERLIKLLIQCLLSEPSPGGENHVRGTNDTTIMNYGKDSENLFTSTSTCVGDFCEQHSSSIPNCKRCDIHQMKKHKPKLVPGNPSHQLPRNCVLASVLRAQRLDSIGAFEARHMLEWLLEHANQSEEKPDILEELSTPQVPTGFGHPCQLPTESKRDYYFRKVWEFLVSLTAKDCSIIITIRKIANGRCETMLRQEPGIVNNLLREKER